MRAVVGDVTAFKSVLESVGKLIDEVKLEFTPEGLSVKAMDRAKVCAVVLELNKDFFDSYEVEERTEIGVNLSEVAKIVKRAKKTDTVVLSIGGEKKDRLLISLEGKGKREFSVPVLASVEQQTPPLEQLNKFTAKANVDTDVFESAVKDVSLFAETLKIEVKKEGENSPAKLMFSGGSELEQAQVVVDATTDIYFTAEGEGKSAYPIDYLKNTLKAVKLVDRMDLELGNEYPLRITIDLGTGKIVFVIAPRVEEK